MAAIIVPAFIAPGFVMHSRTPYVLIVALKQMSSPVALFTKVAPWASQYALEVFVRGPIPSS